MEPVPETPLRDLSNRRNAINSPDLRPATQNTGSDSSDSHYSQNDPLNPPFSSGEQTRVASAQPERLLVSIRKSQSSLGFGNLFGQHTDKDETEESVDQPAHESRKHSTEQHTRPSVEQSRGQSREQQREQQAEQYAEQHVENHAESPGPRSNDGTLGRNSDLEMGFVPSQEYINPRHLDRMDRPFFIIPFRRVSPRSSGTVSPERQSGNGAGNGNRVTQQKTNQSVGSRPSDTGSESLRRLGLMHRA